MDWCATTASPYVVACAKARTVAKSTSILPLWMATSIAGSGLGGTSYTPGSGGGQKGAGGTVASHSCDAGGGGHTGASDAGGELFVRDAGGPWGFLFAMDAGTGAYGPYVSRWRSHAAERR